MVPRAHESDRQTASRSVQPFFAVHQCDQHTDTKSTIRVTSIAIGRIYAMHAMRLNNSATWTLTVWARWRLHVFDAVSEAGIIVEVTRRDRVRNTKIKKHPRTEKDIVNRIQDKRLQYFSHIERIDCHTKQAIYARIHARRPTGRPELRWKDVDIAWHGHA